jgi:hypothetical protein
VLQIESVEEPFTNPEIAGPAFRLLKRADAMGLVTKAMPRLDVPAFREVVRSLRTAGIGREVDQGTDVFSAGKRAKGFDSQAILRLMTVLSDALEESPAPVFEWRRVGALFQPEPQELAKLLGISLSSLRRYSSRSRETPDAVAGRLHFLALLTGDLAGAYNDIGIRNWFQRKRALLDGKAPKDLLRGDWRPGDPGPERVRALARSLAAGSAT